ncbi:MAG: glycosyl hydrolase, partial [Bacteroidota bacterium]
MLKILLGTAKGLVILEKQTEAWKIVKVDFLGFPISFVYVDERTNTWWVALAHRHWGPKLHRSFDQGKSWEIIELPTYPEDAVLSNGRRATLKKMWCMQHAGADRPNGLWLGTEPGGLFYSNDKGDHFELVRELWDHPSRSNAMQWFGAGRDHPFIHSIVVDPEDNKHIYIAVSCAGVFESLDGGTSWRPRNQGLIAAYLPNPNAEVGHDPHRLLQNFSDTKVLWQQNHCGVFRTANGGDSWENVSDQDGFANYGFGLAIDPNNPNRAWVIPAISDEMRVAKDLALVVSYTEDAGQSWQPLRNGLPQQNCFDIVFRHAFQYDANQLVFGTNNGNLYWSGNDGQSWKKIASNLARIDTVSIVV